MKVLRIFCFLSFVAFSQLLSLNQTSDNSIDAFSSSENIIEDEEITSYRLPNNSVPVRYDLWLKTDIDRNIFNFSGTMKIQVKLLEPSQKITLQIDETKVVKIDLLDKQNQLIESNLLFEYQRRFQFLIIFLPRLLTPSETVTLDIEFRGILRTDMLGFYRSSYKNDKHETVWYATTQFQATFARHIMPCYDEPQIRAVMNLQVEHNKRFHAVSNMPVITREEINGTDYVTTKFLETPPMQTYLLALVVSDFSYVSNNDTRVEQRIYAKPQSVQEGDVDYVASIVGPMLQKFEETFGMDFPLPKLDHAAITDFAFAGMENFGLITYREDILLAENGSFSNESSKKYMAEVIAHEVAHQYFGNIVAPKWWSFAWLSEGFAALYEQYMPSLVFPDGNHMKHYNGEFVRGSMDYERKYRTKTLTMHAETPEEIDETLERMALYKGASVLWMFREALTPETFTKGVRYYLTAMSFSAATPDDLHREFQKAFDEDFPGNGVDLDTAMRTWEDQAGFPVVHVAKSGQTFTLTQQRFEGGDEIYTIPISYTTKSQADFNKKSPKLWMKKKTAVINADPSDSWVIVNIGVNGYFKVTYDRDIYSSLVNEIESIPKLYKTQFLEDFSSFAIDLNYEAVSGLEILSAVQNETDFYSWSIVLKVQKLFTKELFGTNIFPKFEKFMKAIIGPVSERVEVLKEKDQTIDEKKLIRVFSMISNELDQTAGREMGRKSLENFLATGDSFVDSCRGLMEVNSSVIDLVKGKLLNISQSIDNSDLLFLGACSMNREFALSGLETFLNNTTKDDENSMDIHLIKKYLSNSPITAVVLLDFTTENYDEILEK